MRARWLSILFACGALQHFATVACAAQAPPREFLRDCRPEDVPETQKQILRWGDVGLDACFALLLRDEFVASEAGRQAATHALAEQWPLARERLRFREGPPPDEKVLARALELIASVGTHAELELACELAARFPRDLEELDDDAVAALERSDDAIAKSVESARVTAPLIFSARGKSHLLATLIAILAREPETLPRVAELSTLCPPEAESILISAFAACGRRDALERLVDHLGATSDRAAELINAVSRAARRVPAPYDERIRRAVRARLAPTDGPGFRAAVLCVGWLEDDECTERLVELLRDPSQGVRADALWSLNRICGVRFAPNVDKWSSWLAGAREWRTEQFPDLLDKLSARDPVAAAAALNEIVRHRFPRHVLAEALARRLVDLDGRAFEMACDALADMGSAAAMPWLEKLAQRDGAEGAALERCLARLTPAPSR